MEVHHHSHHGKKKWTEYFWEFLMLFLAVFCGFLAENQREHYNEKQREKKFARRLLSDLREDSAFYQKRLKNLEEAGKKQGSLVKIMTGPIRATNYEVVSAFMPLLYLYDVQVITATYDQMKASGSLRYIHSDELTTALQKYYEILLPRATRQREGSQTYFIELVAPYVAKHFKVQDMETIGDSLINRNQVILNRSPESDQELINLTAIYSDSQQQLIPLLKPALEKNQELIELIKKEYQLK
jgi:hypothetical protein